METEALQGPPRGQEETKTAAIWAKNLEIVGRNCPLIPPFNVDHMYVKCCPCNYNQSTLNGGEGVFQGNSMYGHDCSRGEVSDHEEQPGGGST